MDYTKLDYFDSVFCPECGKLLKARHYSSLCGGLGDWDADYPDYHTWRTFKCKDCNIKASTDEYKIEDINAWKFPKDYKPTITQKQINYIKYLGNHFWKLIDHTPVITNKELAANWISQFVKLLEDEKREEINDEDINKIFKSYGYKNSERDEEKHELHFYKIIKENSQDWKSRIIFSLIYNKDKKEIIANLQSNELTNKDLKLYIDEANKLPEIINSINTELSKLVYPNEQAGKDQLEKEKQEAKRYYTNRFKYDYDDDPYDPYDGPWLNAFGVE